jgi:hypothetical protein
MTSAQLPVDVTRQFGPQLTALIAYLTVVCHLPRQVVRRMSEGVLNIPISVGSTQHAPGKKPGRPSHRAKRHSPRRCRANRS